MQLAINYSPQAAELQRAGKISLDRFKCPNWRWLIDEARAYLPVCVHFELTAGNSSLPGVDWDEIKKLLEETDTLFLNVHLAPTAADFGFSDEPLTRKQRTCVIDQMLRDVAFAAGRVGSERLIVENIPYRKRSVKDGGRLFLRPCVEPDVISRILNATGAGFLFDLSHARISAGTLGTDEKAYIESLPLERIREMHVTGIHMIDGERRDHFELLPEDWAVFEWFVNKIRAGDAAVPWLVAFEYGGVGEKFAYRSRSDFIAEQVPRLKNLIQAGMTEA